MTAKKARKLRDALMFGGFVVVLAGYFWEPLGIVGLIIMASGLIPHYLWNRCPHCGEQLGRTPGDYCQHCGKPLE